MPSDTVTRLVERYRAGDGAACADLGVALPLDVMTGRTVGYRVDGAMPVVWLAGIHGRVDGGLVAYRRDDDLSGLGVAGTDMIFRLGEPLAR